MTKNFDRRAMLVPEHIDACPFCAGDAEVGEEQVFSQWHSFIRCTNCGARSRSFGGDTILEYAPNSWGGTGKLRAAAAWNARPDRRGTFACPECGVGVPHAHKPASESQWGKLEVILPPDAP